MMSFSRPGRAVQPGRRMLGATVAAVMVATSVLPFQGGALAQSMATPAPQSASQSGQQRMTGVSSSGPFQTPAQIQQYQTQIQQYQNQQYQNQGTQNQNQQNQNNPNQQQQGQQQQSQGQQQQGQQQLQQGQQQLLPNGMPRYPLTPSFIQPFGAALFLRPGGYPIEQNGPNPNSRVLVGDQVRISMYGAMEQDVSQQVDPQGNIFIPQVGPIRVQGVEAGNLNTVIGQKIQQTYKSGDVRTYATVAAVRNIGVFVTGFVGAPGRYPGLPSDSVIDFLSRAGGITNGSGSYRNVTVRRDNKVVHRIDLYDFLLEGTLPRTIFQEGDTIVVGPQDSAVKAEGVARNVAIFEFRNGRLTGRDLMRLARPLPGVTHVNVIGVREAAGFTRYMPVNDFAALDLHDQDAVFFSSDIYANFVSVALTGMFQGPSMYVADRSTTLFQLLDHIPVDPGVAATESVSIKRRGVAAQQKAALNSALDALERSVLTANIQTSGEASIRSAEAQMVLQFLQRARNAQPDGTMVLSGKDGRMRDVRLEEGDVIQIPQRSSTITVSGEVLTPLTYVYDPAFRASDYVKLAGGYSDRADEDRFMVRRLNGAIDLVKDPQLVAGDELIIVPKISFKGFQFAQDISEILFRTLGTAALVVRATEK